LEECRDLVNSWAGEMRKGYTRLIILALLNERPLSGYDIMKEMRDRTLGFWKLTPGGVYPILREMEEKGYLEKTTQTTGDRRRNVYKLTDRGREILEMAAQRHRQIVDAVRGLLADLSEEKSSTWEIPWPPMLPTLKLAEKDEGERLETLKRMRTRLQSALEKVDRIILDLEGQKE